jgi:hypothetical protein
MKSWKGYIEGPLGFLVREKDAKKIEELVGSAPKDSAYAYRKIVKTPDKFRLEGTRDDVSHITTECVDRDKEVVLRSGMDATAWNRVVTFAHKYDVLPVGTNVWMKTDDTGILARTHYHDKPDGWNGDWMPDAILHLMRSDPPSCTGKSIGFLPLEGREPTSDDLKKNTDWADADWIWTKWHMLEYAVAPVPCNPEAEMIGVGKGMDEETAEIFRKAAEDMGFKPQAKAESPIIIESKPLPVIPKTAPPTPPKPAEKPVEIVPIVRPAAIKASLSRQLTEHLKATAPSRIATAVKDGLDKARGRV